MRAIAAAHVILWLGVAACAPVYSRSGTPPPTRQNVVTPAGLPTILGSIVWPLAMDQVSVLSSAYGARHHPVAGSQRFHGGLDLRAPGGTPVYAVAAGRVLASGRSGAYGLRVVVDHGEGLTSLYAHHLENVVAAGERVRRGQVIGLVGRTGNATGEHLHFELRWKGGTVDPWAVLPPLGRGQPSAR